MVFREGSAAPCRAGRVRLRGAGFAAGVSSVGSASAAGGAAAAGGD